MIHLKNLKPDQRQELSICKQKNLSSHIFSIKMKIEIRNCEQALDQPGSQSKQLLEFFFFYLFIFKLQRGNIE